METSENTETSPIERACAVVGGQSALARKLGCTPQAVQKMCATGRVPPHRVLAVESASGVSRHELAPELYPREAAAA
jgi:DNA-binding transcriptional regulator YdaS (Cro superfamily)